MKRAVRIALVLGIALLILGSPNAARAEKETAVFRTKLFACVVPAGWRAEEDARETVRSKVAFRHPTESGLFIRVIAGPKPSSEYSAEDYLEEARQKVSSQLARIAPGTSWTVESRMVGDREYVFVSSKSAGMEIAVHVGRSTYYNIALNWSTESQYASGRAELARFLEAFLPIDRDGFTDAEVRQGMAASKARVAEVLLDLGKLDEAETAIVAGMTLDPTSDRLRSSPLSLGREAKIIAARLRDRADP